MKNRIRLTYMLLIIVVACLVAAGCGKKESEANTTPVKAKPKAPNYEEFAPLRMATTEIELPFIIGGDGYECFKTVEGLEPSEADIMTRDFIEKKPVYVKIALAGWLLDDLNVDGLYTSIIKKWDITVEDPVVVEVPADQLRFVDEGPQCLDKSGWLPRDEHLVTTIIGARKFHFESSLPLGADLRDSLVESLSMANMLVESDALFNYDPAMDSDENPIYDPEDNQLFTSPSGEFILEKDIPPLEARKMTEWTVTTEDPLFFGFKQYPVDGWRKEGAKDNCNVIIIPDALNPQPPDCPEFKESSFSVTLLEEGKPISLTITTGEENKGLLLNWKEATRVQINDRLILWIMPEKVEVGVKLWLNSLVINPTPIDGFSAKDEYEVSDKNYQKSGNYSGKEEKPKRKKKKKKGYQESALDLYLSE